MLSSRLISSIPCPTRYLHSVNYLEPVPVRSSFRSYRAITQLSNYHKLRHIRNISYLNSFRRYTAIELWYQFGHASCTRADMTVTGVYIYTFNASRCPRRSVQRPVHG